MLYTSKESSEHVKCRFRLKKYDLLLKKWKNLILKFFFQRGDPLMSEWSKKIFSVFQNFKKIFEKSKIVKNFKENFEIAKISKFQKKN